MPTNTDTKSEKVDLSAIVAKLVTVSDDVLTDDETEKLVSVATPYHPTQRKNAALDTWDHLTDTNNDRIVAVTNALRSIVATGSRKNAEPVDPNVNRAYRAAATIVVGGSSAHAASVVDRMARKLPTADRATFAAMVAALLVQKPAKRDDRFKVAIDAVSDAITNAKSGQRQTIVGRDLNRIPDGTVFTYQKGKVTVRGGELVVGNKVFPRQKNGKPNPTAAAKAASKHPISANGWDVLTDDNGVSLSDRALGK